MAEEHDSARGLWLHHAWASWHCLNIEECLAACHDKRWWRNTALFSHPTTGNTHLNLIVAADAADNHASWVVMDRHDRYDSTQSSRMWGAQTLYHTQLGGIYAALRLASLDAPLCVYSHTRAAIHAIQTTLNGQLRQSDALANALLSAIVWHTCAHLAFTSLHWTREHATTAGPNLTAEREAFKAHANPPAQPPQELATTHWTLDDQPLDCNWLDAIHTLQHDQCLIHMASHQRSGKFYLHCHSPSSWCSTHLDPTMRTFAFKAHSHALPMAKRVLDYFSRPSNQPITICCALCNRQDVATHWYICPTLNDK